MKIYRIYAIILRYLFLFKHSMNRWSDAFYWPTIDLILWGLTSFYLTKYQPNASMFILVVASGIVFWQIIWRGQYEISVNLLEELWNKNLVNLFVSPLKFFEWITSLVFMSVIKSILGLVFASLVAFILYRIKIYMYGFYLIPFIFLLIVTGWSVGFFVSGFILRFGSKIESFAWTAIALITPFSAIYYPLSVLPVWAQKVAVFIPTSYVFEGAREVINKGYLDWNKILISFGLNIFYLTVSLVWFRKSFDKVLEKGLVKLF